LVIGRGGQAPFERGITRTVAARARAPIIGLRYGFHQTFKAERHSSSRRTVTRGDTLRGADVPPGEIAAADVRHLALSHQLLHRLPDLVPRPTPIDVVHLVEVDVIRLQTPKAGLARPADVW
jgi:hypothetical protein